MFFFPDWSRSLQTGASPLNDQRPWITFAAIRFLRNNLRKDMRVYEYGAGGSTLFFAKRVKEVISVEHDPVWRDQVMEALTNGGHENWRIDLIEPTPDARIIDKDPSDPDAYVSSALEFKGHSFRNYASSIEGYPDGYFDVVVIDGRARPSCFKHALSKVKDNGYIIWDNTDRSYYFPAMQLAPGNLYFRDFPGPSPYVNFFTRTSLWHYQKNNANPN